MALATATITYDIADLTGVDFDARRTRVWVTTNIPDGTIADTVGNQVRLGDGRGSLADDGTGSVTVWVPGTGSNPASWQTTLHVDYQPRGGGGRVVRNFGPFTITANADLADLVTEQAVPAAAVGGDAAVAGFVTSPSSATATALSTAIGTTATPIVQGAIADEAARADSAYAPKPDTLWIPAPDFWPVVGTEERGYGGTNTPHASYGWLLADDGSDFNHSEGASYMLKFPAGWSSATVDVYWAPIGTGGGNVAWRAVIYNVASGNAFDVGSVGTATGATGASTVANRLKITQLSGNLTVDPTQLSRIQIIRNITSSSDTLTGDVLFTGVLIHRVA